MQLNISLVALGAILSVALAGAAHSPAGAVEASDSDKKQSKSDKKYVTVKTGDTLEKIAKKYKLTYVKLFNANKSISHPDQINVGDKIRIPSKGEKLPDRYGKLQASAAATVSSAPVTYAAPASTYTTQQYTTAPVNSSSYYVGNGMWCTDYVASKRSDISVYGNAGYNWISAAQADGKSTGSTPRVGAVAVTNGHVAYVDKVNADGSYTVSEMGWNYTAGQYNQRTVQPGTFGAFIY